MRGAKALKGLATALALPFVFVVMWWMVTDRLRLFDAGLIPGPFAVLHALADWIFNIEGRLYSGTWIQAVVGSSERVMTGFVFGSAAGVTLGVLLGYFPRAALFVEPTIHMLRSIPVISWLPLAFVFFGFGIASAIVLVGVGVFFPVVINTMAGVRGVDRTVLRVRTNVGRQHLSDIALDRSASGDAQHRHGSARGDRYCLGARDRRGMDGSPHRTWVRLIGCLWLYSHRFRDGGNDLCWPHGIHI